MTEDKILKIKGMTCKSCVELIETKLSELDGIESVKVDLVEEKAHIVFNPDKINIDKIESEISKMGYSTSSKPAEKSGNFKQAVVYGLVPHIGCIGFILFSIIGATAAVTLFKPLLMNPYFFHILVLISFTFATISSVVYLKKNQLLSFKGIKRKKKYLATMYGITIGINLLLFIVIFPMLANVGSNAGITGAFLASEAGTKLTLEVDIPCPGHAPLITNEIKTITDVENVNFRFPNLFDISYNSESTKQKILALDVFNTYPAVVSKDSETIQPTNDQSASSYSGGSCCGGSGGCGGSCSGGCGG